MRTRRRRTGRRRSRREGSKIRRAGKKDVSAPGKKGFKRQRTYDDLDEDYDRGRLSKHQRRKAEGRAKSGPGPKGGLKGKTTTLFDSAAKSQEGNRRNGKVWRAVGQGFFGKGKKGRR
jgi:hypothetical protein